MAPPTFAPLLKRDQIHKHFLTAKTTAYSDVLNPRNVSLSHSLKTLAWSPLGNLIATGAGDRTLRIWNPEKAHVKHSTELRGHQGAIERVAWNPAREAELASCSTDGTVRFWDVRSKASVGEIKIPGDGYTLVWHPEGGEVVVGTKDDTIVRISREAMATMGSYPQAVQTNQTVFSNAGNELFLTTGEGDVKMLDYPTMELIHTLPAHTSNCTAINFHPLGSYVVTGGSDSIITLFETEDWFCVRTFDRMSGPVRSVSCSFDGCYLVGGSEESNGIDIAHIESGDYIAHIDCGNAPIVEFSPRSYSLAYAVSGIGGLRIVGVNSGAA